MSKIFTTLDSFKESLLTENLNNKFQIPEEIKHLYKIEGDFSNVENWKAKILEGNSLSSDELKVGDFDKVGYVLISTNSNYIIPIAESDEHRRGIETLYYLIENFKIKDLNYYPVYCIGNIYTYYDKSVDDEFIKEFTAIKKANEYGLTNAFVIKMGTKLKLSIEDYILNGGDFNKGIANNINSGNISEQGEKLIDMFIFISGLFNRYLKNKDERLEKEILKNTKKLYSILISELWDHVKDKNYDMAINNIKKSLNEDDILLLEKSLFSFNGVKNVIHTLLRKNNKDIRNFFYSNKKALEEFNNM